MCGHGNDARAWLFTDHQLSFTNDASSNLQLLLPVGLILLQNHGIIALGATPQAVLACLLMATKAAAIFMGAAAMGGPNFMTAQFDERIAARPDEAYRQKQLKI